MSAGVALPNASGAIAWTTFCGSLISAFDVESEPPAIITSASPRSIAEAAVVIACRPDAHARVTVMPRPTPASAGRARSRAPTFGAVPGRMTPPHTMPRSPCRGTRSARGARATARDAEGDGVELDELRERFDERRAHAGDDHRAARGPCSALLAFLAMVQVLLLTLVPRIRCDADHAPMSAPPHTRRTWPVTPCAPGRREERHRLADVHRQPALPERATAAAPTSRIITGIAAVRRVSMNPGAIALTVMPRPASSGRERAHHSR